MVGHAVRFNNNGPTVGRAVNKGASRCSTCYRLAFMKRLLLPNRVLRFFLFFNLHPSLPELPAPVKMGF
jgi:hypothetical protein